MDSDMSQNTARKESIQYRESTGHALSTIPTSVTLSAEQFEKLYLTPMTRHQPALAKQVGNPTPLTLADEIQFQSAGRFCYHDNTTFVLFNGLERSQWEWSCIHVRDLHDGKVFETLSKSRETSGPIVFLGGLLLLITSILEFILGNTFPCVVFGTIGGFWFAFAATMIPAFNAAAPYSPSATDTSAGLSSASFMNTYAFLFITMAVLMLIFMICATRTNVVYTLIFLALLLVFLLLSSAYWRLGEGDVAVGNNCVKGAGASLFVASLLGFYLLIVQLFEAMGFPFHLPVGDLAVIWDRSMNK
ncbi:uncharacterized protein N7482_002173 [Penicillium canariense]|uniref:Protein alcS n=1 Tax=Penicillium canariense TaxID=189055 RepID=A0A9W9III7_9EURO|nr:uncharacterized protein N7482_002173 [Penicillium canariense]KAJ5176296.1 hypothetical protein N7482_002173 [Penicillium canariense]